ncbi:FecR family protein [Thalassospira lucentensis]|uniref:FecR family protein n=1 Tax=Thalassospira lucentensis TaxID=168935 RepID=UPI003AA8BCAF
MTEKTHHTDANSPMIDASQTDLLDQAIAWSCRNGIDDPTSSVSVAFRKWCAQSSDHQMAADQVAVFMQDDAFDAVMARFEVADSPSRDDLSADQAMPSSQRIVRRKPAAPGRKGGARRSWFGVEVGGPKFAIGALAACLGLLAVLATDLLDAQNRNTLVAGGASMTQTLPDGSQITLAAGTELSWEMRDTKRFILLDRGAIMIKAAHDTSRPMVVSTDLAEVTVVGTRFIVISDPDSNEVSVAQGIVRVEENKTDAHTQVDLMAGQGISIDGDGNIQRRTISEKQMENVLQGWRVFAPKSLNDVAAAISRQSGIRILVDPAISDIDVRGRFNIADGEQSIALLSKSLNISRTNLPFGYVLLSQRF